MHIVNSPAESLFQALTDPTRIRVIRLLATTGDEACLCELVDSLLEPEYKLSRHIKVLKQVGLLHAQKDGRWVYHRLVTGFPHLNALYKAVQALPDSGGLFKRDLSHFKKRLSLREKGRCRTGLCRAN